jgi:hypothetical protein
MTKSLKFWSFISKTVHDQYYDPENDEDYTQDYEQREKKITGIKTIKWQGGKSEQYKKTNS